MDFFYDKEINIYTYNSYNDKYGFDRDGYILKQENVKVDIQAITLEKVKALYGYDVKATYKMYCDETLDEADIILYNDKTYKIEKIIEWDDYSIYLLSETVIDIEL